MSRILLKNSFKKLLYCFLIAFLFLQILGCTVELRNRNKNTIDEIDDARLDKIASDLGVKMELEDRRWFQINKVDLKGEHVFFQIKDSSSIDSVQIDSVNFFWYEHSSKGTAYGAATGLLAGGTLSILSWNDADSELDKSALVIFTGCLTGITTFIGSLFKTEEVIQIENVRDSENNDKQ